MRGMRGEPTDLPQYDQQVPIDVTQAPDVESAGASLISSLRQAGNDAGSVIGDQADIQEQAKQNQLKMEISQATSAFQSTALQNPSAQAGLNGFDDQAKKYASSVLANTNSFNRDTTGNLLNYYTNSNRDGVIDAVNKQAKLSTFANYVQQNAQSADDVSKAINDSDPNDPNRFAQALTLHGQQQQALHNALMTGIVKQGEYDNAFNQNRKSFQQQVVLKQYQDAVTAGKVPEFMQNFEKEDLPGLNTQDKLAMIHDFSAITNNRLADLGTTRAQLDQSQKDNITGILNGGQPNATVMSNTQMVEPEKADGYKQQVQDAQNQYSIMQHAATLPPSDQQTLLSALKPTDPTSPTFGHDIAFYNTVSKLVDNDNKKFQADPMTYIKNHPALQQAAQSYNLADNASATAPNNPSSNINDPVQKPWDQAVQLQTMRGLNLFGGKNSVKLLTNGDSKAAVGQISVASPQTQIQYFNQLRQTYGKYYPVVLKQLNQDGLPQSAQMVAALSPTDPNITQYAQALNSNRKDITSNLAPKDISEMESIMRKGYDTTGVTASPAFNNYVRSLPEFNGSSNQDMVNQAKQGLLKIAFDNMNRGATSTPLDAVGTALDSVGNQFGYTTVNGKTLRVPLQFNPDSIKNYVNENQESLVKSFPFQTNNGSKSGLTPEQASQLDREQLINKGHFVTTGDNQGLVWVDKNNQQRTDKNGSPLIIKYSDAEKNSGAPLTINNILEGLRTKAIGINPYAKAGGNQ